MGRSDFEPRIYRYVHVSDDGMAPCIDRGLLTLATCKPRIRKTARPGDWVIGFYPKPWDPGVVSWAARISDKMEHVAYQGRHGRRSDAVYAPGPDGRPMRLREDYHPLQKDMDKDLSAPVLIFDRAQTWYLGDRPGQLTGALLHLAARGQGHRVNFRKPSDERKLAAWLASLGRPGIHGKPRHAGGCAPCGKPPPNRGVSACRNDRA